MSADKEVFGRFLTAVFTFGVIFFTGSLLIYGFHHVYVVPSPGVEAEIETEIMNYIGGRADCSVENVNVLAEEIGRDVWQTRYVTQQLINSGTLGLHPRTGDIVQRPCFKTVEP